MKKLVSFLTAVFLIIMLFSMPAFAHRHSGGRTRTGYALCTVENCSITYSHRHGKTWYGGHAIGDGHEYHEVCSVNSCTLTTTHDHDGVICFPHSQSDGHSYHTLGYGGGGRHH